MSTIIKKSSQKCEICSIQMIETSMKNPFTDDFIVCCENEKCSKYIDGESYLNNQSYAIAREESRRDYEFKNTDHGDED